MSAAVFDYAGLCDRVAGRVDLVETLIDMLLSSYPTERRGIGERAADRDAAGVRELAHRLKGQLQTLGVDRAAGEALRLELMGKDGCLNDVENALAALDREMDCFAETVVQQRAARSASCTQRA